MSPTLLLLLIQSVFGQQTTCVRGGNNLYTSSFSRGVDSSFWSHEYYSPNGERQVYTNNADTFYTSGGNLVIRAFKDNRGTWNSARLLANRGWNNFRAEVVFKLDQAVDGAFPAIWMQPVGGWAPDDGEIDLMEYSQAFPVSPVQQAVQTRSQNNGWGPTFRRCNPDVTNWVNVAVEQTDRAVTFYCNGQLSGAYNRPENSNFDNWPFSSKQYALTLNYAIQPSFMGPVPDHVNSLSMTISSIKVTSCFSDANGSNNMVVGSAPL
ncbi:concanavalin A-like lectin/glucanase domain-containing protein [Globomyces pollinis-pini]|nr:concanavalin A-like lectin/glucanase domain-containing protein [Globomyces pollinis-pini]KAJ2999918.1 hypothetical protein HDV02_001437 [Globomyces sp. JEL0801]